MRNLEDEVIALAAICAVLIVVAGFVAIGVWTWQDAADKRVCRRTGGAVVVADHNEWHCVGATPETR